MGGFFILGPRKIEKGGENALLAGAWLLFTQPKMAKNFRENEFRSDFE
jgi:hypothetical protein